MAENPQDKQQSVSPTGLGDAIEAQRQAEAGTDGTGNPVTNPLKSEDEYDEDGYPTSASASKPDNWNDMSDDEKREYVYSNADQNPSGDDDDDNGATEMGSNQNLVKSGKGQLFGNGPDTVNVTNHAKKIDPPKGRILRVGEETAFSGTVVGQMAVVDEDVYREVYPFRSKRPSYVLVYVKGTAVPLNTLNNLGINTDEAQAASLKAIEDEQDDDTENKDK